ncbi:hypothetical protein SAMN05216553_11616 [Lentzea fradiae]|uniref:Uncharacterized protein n=1 Tax=Lentzea fradiae TaxID=200378 RepID=A0A1G7ZQ88_9PSEU|nr:hypothetical protein [Lentzea fradiae]SDH10819.1 hypothetical protein SAMN05216553_11616 [Lentzea fradiae]
MTKEEGSSTAADVRTVSQAALLVLGTGMTLLDGWVLGGIGGVVAGIVFAGAFLGGYYAISQEKPATNGRVFGLAACVLVTLFVFLSATT